eukprot:COSAG05_NODE_20633_length_278_cov_0.575419_1_plen_72_part_10
MHSDLITIAQVTKIDLTGENKEALLRLLQVGSASAGARGDHGIDHSSELTEIFRRFSDLSHLVALSAPPHP